MDFHEFSIGKNLPKNLQTSDRKSKKGKTPDFRDKKVGGQGGGGGDS
jgi:hypothetical protein